MDYKSKYYKYKNKYLNLKNQIAGSDNLKINQVLVDSNLNSEIIKDIPVSLLID